jgi:hypothetical protein
MKEEFRPLPQETKLGARSNPQWKNPKFWLNISGLFSSSIKTKYHFLLENDNEFFY